MGIQFNIKSAEARELADRLADLTGENLTEAVTGALREKVERIERRNRMKKESVVEKWLAIGADIKRRYPDMPGSADVDILLYDENGLPK